MNKFYILIITLSIIAGFSSCKKEAKQPTKPPVDFSALIIGNWGRTKAVDSAFYDGGGVTTSSVATSNDYGYVFKSDGTGSRSQLGLKVSDITFAIAEHTIAITVIQSYNQDGTPSNVHITPFSLDFIKLTDSELVLRKETTYTAAGLPSKDISIDYYTKH